MKNKTVIAVASALIVLSSMTAINASAEEYTVKSGESLSVIASYYPDETITVSSIMRDNNLKTSVIQPGWVLQINSKSSTKAEPSATTTATPIGKIGNNSVVKFTATSWYLYTSDGTMQPTGEFLKHGSKFTILKYSGNDTYVISYQEKEYSVFIPEDKFQKFFSIEATTTTTKAETPKETPTETSTETTKTAEGEFKNGTSIKFNAQSFYLYSSKDFSKIVGYLENGDVVTIKKNCGNNYYIVSTDFGDCAICLTTTSYNRYFSEITETTETTETTKTPETKLEAPKGFSSLPDSVMSVIDGIEKQYPSCKVAAGVYDLSGNGYSYNAGAQLYAGCSFKAAYATYVLKQCENLGINIDTKTIEYTEELRHGGSGTIQYNFSYGDRLSVRYLIQQLITISDNTAYRILLSEFPMSGYKEWLSSVGGQQQISNWQLFGAASVNERKNEWVQVWNYLNSGSENAQFLKSCLSSANPCFLGSNSVHKSGSSNYADYICASDAGVIDGRYILVIIVQDAQCESNCASAVRSIASSIRQWVDSNSIY